MNTTADNQRARTDTPTNDNPRKPLNLTIRILPHNFVSVSKSFFFCFENNSFGKTKVDVYFVQAVVSVILESVDYPHIQKRSTRRDPSVDVASVLVLLPTFDFSHF
jgi:hypothetical protein